MIYENLMLDEERALYGIKDAEVRKCTFDGPADGESALKECENVTVTDCDFRLRYPFWHVKQATIKNSRMTEGCRAALWYDDGVSMENCELNGIKAFRECDHSELTGCSINSKEFGWKCRDMKLVNCELVSEYPFFECQNMTLENFKLQGKYSFQYVDNMTISNSVLDTKDAFWHSKNITVTDSIVKGEYLGWYSENLTFKRCKIIGTQPLCYAKNLVLEDCTMEGTDLAFEYSSVQATINGEIMSVKNPLSGKIEADSIGEIILEHSVKGESTCEICMKE